MLQVGIRALLCSIESLLNQPFPQSRNRTYESLYMPYKYTRPPRLSTATLGVQLHGLTKSGCGEASCY